MGHLSANAKLVLLLSESLSPAEQKPFPSFLLCPRSDCASSQCDSSSIFFSPPFHTVWQLAKVILVLSETHLLGRTPFPPFLYCLMSLNAMQWIDLSNDQMIIICVTSTQIRDRWTIGRLRRKWKILTLAEFEPCRCQDFIRPSVVEPSIQMGRVMPLTSLSSPSSSSSLWPSSSWQAQCTVTVVVVERRIVGGAPDTIIPITTSTPLLSSSSSTPSLPTSASTSLASSSASLSTCHHCRHHHH